MLNNIAKDIATTVKESVQSGIKSLSEKFEPRLKAIEERLDDLPVPKDGKSVSIEDVAPLIKELVDAIELPVPEKGESGIKGDSVTIDDVRPILQAAVVEATKDLKVPEIDYETVKTFITNEVAKVPLPKDGENGKSVSVEDVAPLIKELVDAIELPVPKKGEDGKSVTLEEVKPLIDSAVKVAVSEIPLPKDGKNGEDAVLDMGAVQKLIDEAVEKAVAKIHIPEPKNGEDGKDALDIEIMPEIDQTKSYSRNSYALHKGGIWRSYERTNGMRGWENLIDGIADIQIEYDGERGVKIVTEKSSGEIVSKDFSIPAMIYREIYKEGQTYKQGDTVTWAGSAWTCLKDTEDKPGSDAWRLSVKAGRNASQPVKVK